MIRLWFCILKMLSVIENNNLSNSVMPECLKLLRLIFFELLQQNKKIYLVENWYCVNISVFSYLYLIFQNYFEMKWKLSFWLPLSKYQLYLLCYQEPIWKLKNEAFLLVKKDDKIHQKHIRDCKTKLSSDPKTNENIDFFVIWLNFKSDDQYKIWRKA